MRLRWQLRRRFINGRYICRGQGPTWVLGADASRLVGRRQQGRRLLKMTGRLCLRHPWRLWQRDRTQYPYYQQYLVEIVGQDLFKLGGLVEQFQQTLLAGITGNVKP